MFSIIANPTDASPNLSKIDLASVFKTKHMVNLGRNTASQDQNGGYAYYPLQVIGSTNINSHLLTLNDPDVLDTADVGSQGCFISTYNNRTAKYRAMCPIAFKTGVTIQGFTVFYPSRTLTGSGVTGTLTVSLETIDTDGTVTVVATYTGTISATLSNDGWAAVAASPVAITAGQKVAISIEVAPATGTHTTSNYTSVQLSYIAGRSIIYIY